MNIKNLKNTCTACPAQWEAETEDGRIVYIRYRYGQLSMGIGKTLEDAIGDRDAVDIDHGGDLDGYMEEPEMLCLLGLSVVS